jgi:tetratricopeptide (TPR) repeat protein
MAQVERGRLGELGNMPADRPGTVQHVMRAGQAVGSKLIEMRTRAQRAFVEGRLGEAEFNCRLVLGANKKDFEALHLLGLIEFQRGKFEEAHRLICHALRVNARSAKAHSNLALVLQQLNRLEEALTSVDRALAIEPDFLLALNNRGHILWRLQRSEKALQSLDRALALKPDYVDALCNRGNALVDLRRMGDALACYDQVLGINPKDALALNNRANVLWALDRRDEAMQNYDRALALSPDDLSILKDRGAALAQLKRSEDALACFDHALALKPDDPYFLYKRSSALSDLNRDEEALACLDRAFALAPDDADALGDRGNVLSALQRHAEAIASYDRALAISPDSAKAHWNRGLALLRMGDLERGWREFEWRWEVKETSVRQHGFDQQRLWRGEQPIEGKTVLLHAEQGLGDTIQFVRYVPDVVALGAKVIVQVHPELKTLISSIAGADRVIGKGEQVPAFDLHCPLMSLPLAFNTRLETIPAKIPYLSGASEPTAFCSDWLIKSTAPKIGIAWAGNPSHANDRLRSIALPRLMPLLSAAKFQFVSIQKDLRDGDLKFLREHPQLIHLGDKIADFSETAAIMSHLDLVVAVDTAVAHLAGALGRPVWVLLDHTPDWRWMVQREDSPWYPSARLFRQRAAGDWGSVVGRVVEALGSSHL